MFDSLQLLFQCKSDVFYGGCIIKIMNLFFHQHWYCSVSLLVSIESVIKLLAIHNKYILRYVSSSEYDATCTWPFAVMFAVKIILLVSWPVQCAFQHE